MAVKLTFFGGVGDYHEGELGGVQGIFHDIDRNTRFMLDCGQRPDHTNEYYGFPFRPKAFQALALSEYLQLYPELENLYRHDYEHHRGRVVKELPLEGILVTHPHYDHVGGIHLVRHDMPVYMHPVAKMVLWLWQYSSGRTVNQFIDLIDQFTMVPNDSESGMRFLSGEEAVLPRDIRLYKENVPFNIENVKVTPFLVDHSTPGSCGFIVETSAGKIGISGDLRIRGRHPENTEKFIDELMRQDISYLLWEGSLIDMEHNGTEYDVQDKLTELMKGRAFFAVTYPPRDFERLLSVYEAAKANKRMLVIPPTQAIALQLFNGINGYPRLDWKYIGVFLPRKRKGLLDREEFSSKIVEADYNVWERKFLGKAKWDEHESKIQRVSAQDLREHQDQFVVYISPNYLPDILEEVGPAQGSRYARLHPAPWTDEMTIQERRIIALLSEFNMYEGSQEDHLNPGIMRNMHQVHITGHKNFEETSAVLHRFRCKILPYHCKYPQMYKQFVNDPEQLMVLVRGQEMVLQ